MLVASGHSDVGMTLRVRFNVDGQTGIYMVESINLILYERQLFMILHLVKDNFFRRLDRPFHFAELNRYGPNMDHEND